MVVLDRGPCRHDVHLPAHPPPHPRAHVAAHLRRRPPTANKGQPGARWPALRQPGPPRVGHERRLLSLGALRDGRCGSPGGPSRGPGRRNRGSGRGEAAFSQQSLVLLAYNSKSTHETPSGHEPSYSSRASAQIHFLELLHRVTVQSGWALGPCRRTLGRLVKTPGSSLVSVAILLATATHSRLVDHDRG